jgi:homocitrate synthase
MRQELRIIDTTLREGEQCARAQFDSEQKLAIARALDAFGVDYLELTSPSASPRARRDFEQIARLGLRAKLLAHVRCVEGEVQAAADAGAQGVGLFLATSPVLREASHGRSIQQVIDAMARPVACALRAGLEVRFSAEDAFRTPEEDLVTVCRAAAALGVHRVGLPDTVGVATPCEVHRRVELVRAAISLPIGFHGHNDTGCAVANAYEAVAAGATHVDVSVLGIGERVGITPLGAFVARMLTVDRERMATRYRLDRLFDVERLVARSLGVDVPFNNCVTGETAYTHKAGPHLKAMLANPQSYEGVPPEPFGVRRKLIVGSHLTGRHAVAGRALSLGLDLDARQIPAITARIKELADHHDLSDEQIDALLREWVPI